MIMLLTSILAGSRIRFIERLYEGDVVAWSCLAVGVAVSIGIGIIKKKLSGRQNLTGRG